MTNKQDTSSMSVRPLTVTEVVKGPGRPRKLPIPTMPDMPMKPEERALFVYFIDSYREQYPDMVPTDHLILFLAGLEYIKYLRVIQEELDTGKVISMARQHPGVNMRALLDQLSVTRKARNVGAKSPEDEATNNARNLFRQMSE